MPDQNKIQAITQAATFVRKAQQSLMQASRACTDPIKSQKITAEYTHLDSILSQLLQTIAITDDAAFSAAANSLKQSAQVFDNDEKQLKSIIDDVGVAANIAGYLVQAAGFIAKL